MSLPDGRRRAVVWDLDGTLIDSAPDLAAALNAVLCRHGFEGHSVRAVRAMVGDGVEKLVERGFAVAGISPLPGAVPALAAEFMAAYVPHATAHTRPYPLVRRALQRLERAGLRQGICTNKPEGVSRRIAAELDLERYMGCIIGGDTTPAKKPDPAPLAACLERLGVSPAYGVLIGDSAADVAAARALQMPVGVVSWGYSKMPAHFLGADFVVRHPEDLAALVEAVGRQQLRKSGTA